MSRKPILFTEVHNYLLLRVIENITLEKDGPSFIITLSDIDVDFLYKHICREPTLKHCSLRAGDTITDVSLSQHVITIKSGPHYLHASAENVLWKYDYYVQDRPSGEEWYVGER